MRKLLVFMLSIEFLMTFLNTGLFAQQQKVIKLNAMGWVQAEWPLKDLAAQYEKLHPDIKIVY